MKHVLPWWAVLFLAVGSLAQTTTSATPKRKSLASQAIDAELQELKNDRALERQQINALQQEVAKRPVPTESRPPERFHAISELVKPRSRETCLPDAAKRSRSLAAPGRFSRSGRTHHDYRKLHRSSQ